MFNPDVNHAGDGAWGIIGVQGTENKMPCEGGLNHHFCGFPVPDFTDHQHIRIVPENRAEPGGKGKVNFGIDLDLAYIRNLILNGIFNGNDFFIP